MFFIAVFANLKVGDCVAQIQRQGCIGCNVVVGAHVHNVEDAVQVLVGSAEGHHCAARQVVHLYIKNIEKNTL